MNLEKEKDFSKEKGRAAEFWPSFESSPASPPGDLLFPLSRASARVQSLTGRPHLHLAHFADERARSTSSSSSPNRARDHVAAAVMAGNGAA